MKLRVFQSGKGDCLLLTGDDGRLVLIDGGVKGAFKQHVAPALGRLRENGKELDLVYLSHIDQDHIAGILQLFDDEVSWRTHEFQLENGNAGHKPPKSPRPPRVKSIWHNAFHEQIGQNAGDIEQMLAASAQILSGSTLDVVKELASSQADLATSISEAIQLTRRVGPEQLGVKLNAPAKGKLMMARSSPTPAIKVGGLRFHIIGPFKEDLENLKVEWNNWLRNNRDALKKIQQKADADALQFSVREIRDILGPKLAQARSLSELLPLDSLSTKTALGDRNKVTVPNLASLMFFVEENGNTLLLTGDGHHSEIIHGLKRIKKMNGTGGLHVNVLKVPHHASEFNVDEAFCRTITADHYIFCGNGEHQNPDLQVIQAIADSRLGGPSAVSPNPQARDSFKFWFNSDRSQSSIAKARDHMKKVEQLVAKIAGKSGGKLKSQFLSTSSFQLSINGVK
jgi:beta-lactamase superfamily II metal-dependent hydrolase